MKTHGRLWYLQRSVFGLVKRPIWLTIHSLTGVRIQATAEYLDFGCYGGYFEALSGRVAQHLPAHFTLIESRPGFVAVEIWCAQYRRMDILRPYNELAVIVPVQLVRRKQSPVEGGYVLHMPVTSEEARWAGVDNHGFPKILADIAIVDRDGSIRCVVHHRGVHVLTLLVDSVPVEPIEQTTSLLNVRDDGEVIRTDFELSGYRGVADSPGGVLLELGHHAIAEDLRRMGVRPDKGRALYEPRLHGLLGKARDLGPLADFSGPTPRQTATPGDGGRGEFVSPAPT